MNRDRRKALEKISDELSVLQDRLQEVIDEEQEAYENMPESLQEGERGEAMYEGIDTMENALSSIEEAADYLSDVWQS